MCIATPNSATAAASAEPLPPGLARAYRLTRYQVSCWEIRVGRRPPAALFVRIGGREAIVLTAWNPRSRHMPDAWNRRMQRRLWQRLRRRVVVEAEGSLAGWREAMLLVGGDHRPSLVLARRFRQHAVLVLRRGAKVRLRFV